jgi:hypothetical protein
MTINIIIIIILLLYKYYYINITQLYIYKYYRGTINNDRIAAAMYSLGTWFDSGIHVHKGDNDGNNNNLVENIKTEFLFCKQPCSDIRNDAPNLDLDLHPDLDLDVDRAGQDCHTPQRK